MAAPEISVYEMKAFISFLEDIETSGRKDIMITSPTTGEDCLLIARGGKNKGWTITAVRTSEVEGWGEEKDE